jgi:hypothetical protein
LIESVSDATIREGDGVGGRGGEQRKGRKSGEQKNDERRKSEEKVIKIRNRI